MSVTSKLTNAAIGLSSAIALASAASAQDLKFPVGEGAFNWDSYNQFAESHDLSGQSLTIFGPWLSGDQALFESMLAYFEEATGADVQYTGSDSFETQIRIDTEAGSAPNIAVFPQPGLARDLAARGLGTLKPRETDPVPGAFPCPPPGPSN